MVSLQQLNTNKAFIYYKGSRQHIEEMVTRLYMPNIGANSFALFIESLPLGGRSIITEMYEITTPLLLCPRSKPLN